MPFGLRVAGRTVEMTQRVAVHSAYKGVFHKLILRVDLEVIERQTGRGVRKIPRVDRARRIVKARMAVNEAQYRGSKCVVDACTPHLLPAREEVRIVRRKRASSVCAWIVDLHICRSDCDRASHVLCTEAIGSIIRKATRLVAESVKTTECKASENGTRVLHGIVEPE